MSSVCSVDFLVAYGKKSLEEIFNEIWPMARNQSSSEFKRMLDGCFLVARAQEIFGGNLFKEVASQEINHRNLDGY